MFGWQAPFNLSDFGLPERPTRQWLIENSDLAGKPLIKTPDYIEVSIPPERRPVSFTHATYVLICDHAPEDPCNCPDDDTLEWEFVEFFDINQDILPKP